MEKAFYIPELPCENLVRTVCGPQWRNLNKPDIDAAWGIAIIHSVLHATRADLTDISIYLGVDRSLLADAFERLRSNGRLTSFYLQDDREALESGDALAYGYIGGYASGAIGISCRE